MTEETTQEAIDHVVTAEDITENPELVEQGLKEGEQVSLVEAEATELVPEDVEDGSEESVPAETSPEETLTESVVETPEESDDSCSSEATVVDENGAPVRTYSLEVHGEDYRALAQSFANKKGYKVA